MDRRFIAVAAGFAVMALAGAHPAAAAASAQCLGACDKTFQTCNGTNPDTSSCLPKWGQCKRACSGPVAVTPVKTVAPVAKLPAAPAKPDKKGKTDKKATDAKKK